MRKMLKQLEGSHEVSGARRVVSKCIRDTRTRSSQRLVTVSSLSIVWLLMSQISAGRVECETSSRAGDLDGKRQQQELSVMRDPLAAYGQLESLPDAVRRLVTAKAVSRASLSAMDFYRKLFDNYRESQAQSAPSSGSLDLIALDRLALEQRAAAEEEARRLLQLIGPDYGMAQERLEIDKKAAKHTPRFG